FVGQRRTCTGGELSRLTRRGPSTDAAENRRAPTRPPGAPWHRSANPWNARVFVEDYAEQFLFANGVDGIAYLGVCGACIPGGDEHVLGQVRKYGDGRDFRHRRTVHDDEALLVPPPNRIHQLLHLHRGKVLLRAVAPPPGRDQPIARYSQRLDYLLDVQGRI